MFNGLSSLELLQFKQDHSRENCLVTVAGSITGHVWPWLGPSLTSGSTLCTSGFIDDVMFSHNGASGTKSNMT